MNNKIKNINNNLEYYTLRINNYLGKEKTVQKEQENIPETNSEKNNKILNSIKKLSAKKNIFKKNNQNFEPDLLINKVIEEENQFNLDEEYEYEIIKHNDFEEKIKDTGLNINKLLKKQEKQKLIEEIGEKYLLPKFCPDDIGQEYDKYLEKDFLKENNVFKGNKEPNAEKFLMGVLAEEMNSFKKRKNKFFETIYENQEKIDKLKKLIKKKKLKLNGGEMVRKTVKKGKKKLKDLISKNIDLLKILKQC